MISATLQVHKLLSLAHTDTLAASVVEGDTLIGNSTPAWSRLPIGASGNVLTSNGTTLSWAAPVTSGTAWQLTGNSGLVDATNFIGTTAAAGDKPLNFRVAGEKAGKIGEFGPTFFGYQAGNVDNGASANSGFGYLTMAVNTTGSSNSAFGGAALGSNVGGADNTAIGAQALGSNVSGNASVALGKNAGFYETASNSLYIHNGLGVTTLANGKTNSLIYGVFDATASNQTLMINGVLSTSQIGNSAGNVLTTDGTQTLTNKAITPRVNTIADSATPTPVASTTDMFTVTALAQAATFASPGVGVHGQRLMIRIKDDGTARALAWNAIYRASTDLALPTTTTISKTIYILFIYNTTDSTWDLLAKTDGF